MRINYQYGGEQLVAFTRELPAGLFSRAGVVYLARMLAEEIVGSGLAERARAAAIDDDGSTIVACEVSALPPDSRVKRGPLVSPGRRCADCLAPVKRGRPCPDCGGCASFDGACLGRELLAVADE